MQFIAKYSKELKHTRIIQLKRSYRNQRKFSTYRSVRHCVLDAIGLQEYKISRVDIMTEIQLMWVFLIMNDRFVIQHKIGIFP